MADVTVEFGAQDVGLQKTLSKIQDEMAGLQTSVKSGELTMEELEKTMRRIGQVESMEKRIKAMGDASADSSPQIKNLGQQLENAGDKAKTIGGIFDAEFSKIAGAFTIGNLAAEGFQKIVGLAFDAARQVAQGFSDALDLGGRLNELSQRTGESAGKLLVLETAFKNSGLEASTVGTAINKLQNFMQDAANGSDKQRAAMQNLGISMSDLAGKTPTEQMKIFADRIAGIEDPTARAAAASEVFGDKLGGKLLPLFSDFSGNLDDARGKVGSLEQVMDENAATFDTAAETIDAVKGKMVAFAAGILSQAIPAVKGLGEEMSKVDAAGFGENAGKALNESFIPAVKGAVLYTKELFALLNTTPAKGQSAVYDAVAESLNGFNYYMAQAFNNFTPFGYALTALTNKGKEVSQTQTEANAAIKETGTAADETGKKIQDAGKNADIAGQSMAESFSLGADFKPTVDGISSGWSDLNSQIAGTKPLLEGNFSLADSIAGKTDEQAQSIGGVNDEAKVSAGIMSDIEKSVAATDKKIEDQKAKQAASNEEKQKSLELDLSILKAQISGNEEEVKALNYQKDYNAALKQAIDAGMGKSEAEAFADQIARARSEQAGINKELTASQKLLKDIADAEGKKGIDKGGRLAKRAQDQVARGDFAGARKTASKIAENEAQAALTGVGQNRDRRDMADIGKDYGLNRGLGESSSGFRERIRAAREDGVYNDFSKTAKPASGLEAMKAKGSLKDELADRRAGVDKPGQDGQKPPVKDDTGGKKGLDGLVEKILELVQKIEPRLPVAALTA